MSHVTLIIVAGRDLSARRESGINNPYVKGVAGPHSLKLELWDRTDSTNGRTGIYVGALAVDLSHLQDGSTSDGWYALNNLAGDLRLRITLNGAPSCSRAHGHCGARHGHHHHCHDRADHAPYIARPNHQSLSPRHYHPPPITHHPVAVSPRLHAVPSPYPSPYGGLGGYIGYHPTGHHMHGHIHTAAPAYFLPPGH